MKDKILQILQVLVMVIWVGWGFVRVYNAWDEPMTMGTYYAIGFLPFICCMPVLALIVYLRFRDY